MNAYATPASTWYIQTHNHGFIPDQNSLICLGSQLRKSTCKETHCSTNFEYKFFGVQSPGVVLSSRLHDLFHCWIIKGVQDCFSSVLCQFCVFLSQHSVYFLTVVRKNVFLQWKLSVSFMLDEYSEGHGSVSCVNLCDHCVFSLCLFLLVVLRFWTL